MSALFNGKTFRPKAPSLRAQLEPQPAKRRGDYIEVSDAWVKREGLDWRVAYRVPVWNRVICGNEKCEGRVSGRGGAELGRVGLSFAYAGDGHGGLTPTWLPHFVFNWGYNFNANLGRWTVSAGARARRARIIEQRVKESGDARALPKEIAVWGLPAEWGHNPNATLNLDAPPPAYGGRKLISPVTLERSKYRPAIVECWWCAVPQVIDVDLFIDVLDMTNAGARAKSDRSGRPALEMVLGQYMAPPNAWWEDQAHYGTLDYVLYDTLHIVYDTQIKAAATGILQGMRPDGFKPEGYLTLNPWDLDPTVDIPHTGKVVGG